MRGTVQHFFNTYKAHLISWGIFMLYETILVGTLSGRFSSFWDYFAHYAINISLFYLHATVLLPAVLRKNRLRYALLPLLVAGEILFFIGITYAAEQFLTQYLRVELMRPLLFDFTYCLRSTWRAIYFIGFATGYYFLLAAFRERERAEKAEKQQLLHLLDYQKLQNELIKSQNAFLKAQINPHFLFNTLNFVYNSVRKTSGQAAEAILSLAQMMRYALQNEDEHQETALLDEIEHVTHLIYIHQIRHDHRLQVELIHGDNLAGVKLIPLVLITLVENIFKHGDLTQQAHPATISITFEGNNLHIRTRNLRNSDRAPGHRIGLDNIQRRLAHVYRHHASFEAFADEKGYFQVDLQITDPGGTAAIPSVRA